MIRRAVLIVSLSCVAGSGAAQDDLTAAYREPAGRILGAALTDVEGWEKLAHLATEIGHRLSGSRSLERAIDWAQDRMDETRALIAGGYLETLPLITHHYPVAQAAAAWDLIRDKPEPVLGVILDW